MIADLAIHPLARATLRYFLVEDARAESGMDEEAFLRELSSLLRHLTPAMLHEALTDLLNVARHLHSNDHDASTAVAKLVERAARYGAQRWGGHAALTLAAEDAGRRFDAFSAREERRESAVEPTIPRPSRNVLEEAWAGMSEERRARLAVLASSFLESQGTIEG